MRAASSCRTCGRYSRFPVAHKTLGWVCQHCFTQLPTGRKKLQGYYADFLALRPSPTRRKTVRLLTVAERDGWICQLCGKPVEPKGFGRHRPSIDHILRRRAGGSDALSNLRLAHQSCNEYREGANVEPFAPSIALDNGDVGVPSESEVL